VKEALPKFLREYDKQNGHGSNNENNDVPLLVLLSFADRVLAEIMDENGGKCDKATAKQEIKEHFEVGSFIKLFNTLK
jgi:hypothetical protein